ncbi:unnamed protein product [Ilex paraguariensis]|uniref:Uncharacterized protein n=1 Tax=Ilex paraguariensis TaxID=185542 RepID=A0ABC8SN84_9AQUA
MQVVANNGNAVLMPEVKAIESEVSDAQKARLKVLCLRDHLAKVHEVEAGGRCSSLLKEAKISNSLVIKAATRDLEQRQKDLVAAQEQIRQAERCVEAFKLDSLKILSDVLKSSFEESFPPRNLDEHLYPEKFLLSVSARFMRYSHIIPSNYIGSSL